VLHERPAAVEPRAHLYIRILVEHPRDLLWVGAVDGERDDADPGIRPPAGVDPDPVESGEPPDEPGGQVFFVPPYPLHPYRREVIHGDAEGDTAPDVLCARLIAPVAFRRHEPFGRHALDHAAAKVRGLKYRLPHPEDAGAGRAEQLVPRETEEVAIDLRDIHRHMRQGLCAVHEEHGAVFAAEPGNLRDRRRHAEDVRGVSDRNEPDAAAGKCTLECGKVERVVGIDPDHVEGDALFRKRSPGQEV